MSQTRGDHGGEEAGQGGQDGGHHGMQGGHSHRHLQEKGGHHRSSLLIHTQAHFAAIA